jgi:DNA-binding HxlR family transcriptional regulator
MMAYVKKRPALDSCPVEVVIAIIGGKWKARIIRVLADGPCTFVQLKRQLSGITQQVLSTQLKALEEDGMVHREATELPLPPGSMYSLTDEARDLLTALNALAFWGLSRLRRAGLTCSKAHMPLELSPGGTRPERPHLEKLDLCDLAPSDGSIRFRSKL